MDTLSIPASTIDTSPTAGTFLLTRADGSTATGTFDEVGKLFALDGFVGKISKIVPPAPTPAPVPATFGVVSAPCPLAVERIKRQVAEVARLNDLHGMGFALPDTFFAPGTALLQVGKDKYQSKRTAWESRPLVDEAFDAVATAIEAEKRTDIVCSLSDLVMDYDGKLKRSATGKPALEIEPAAFDRLITMAAGVFPSGRALMHSMDVDNRAEVWNRQIAKLDEGKQVKIGVRRNVDGVPQIYRAVSTGYGDGLPAHVALRDCRDALKGEGMRGSVTYDPGSTDIRWEASWHAPRALDAKVGDVFRVGLKGSTNDAGNGRFTSALLLERILCINLTTAEAYGGLLSRVHRGDMSDTRAQFGQLAALAPDVFGMFALDWNLTRETEVNAVEIYGVRYPDVPTALAGLVEREKITSDIARDALTEILLTGWQAEPGNTLADIVNAITRSHSSTLLDDIARDALERQASVLVPILAGYAREVATAK